MTHLLQYLIKHEQVLPMKLPLADAKMNSFLLMALPEAVIQRDRRLFRGCTKILSTSTVSRTGF